MKVLVTGATGFVGRHLVPALEAAGHALTLALRNADAATRLPDAPTHSQRRTVVMGDLSEHTDWRDGLRGADAVIHLAARAHVLTDGPDETDALDRVNARGTARLVDQALDAGVERFVLMSSIGAVTSASENCVTLATPSTPDTPYGRSKHAAERNLIERAAGTKMSWTILRPTLVYGPGNPGNMQRLVSLVQRGLPLPLGAVRNRRSFTFVGNLADVTAIALTHPGARNAVFLVADGEDLSTPELVRRIARYAEVSTPLVPVPLPILRGVARTADLWASITNSSPGFGTQALKRLESSLYVDIDPLRTKLAWTPPVGVDEGLRCMLTPQ